MAICCICLEDIKDKNLIKTLSCKHTIHYQCYMKLCFNDITFFINCPMCRTKNLNVEKPYNNPKKNLLALCSPVVEKEKCLKKNCNNCSFFFNYGYCHNHCKPVLSKKYQNLFLKYFYYLFTSNKKGFKTKIYMLDMAKKLIIKNNLKQVDEIIIIFSTYFEKYNYSKQGTPDKFYEEHSIKLPPKEWINYCVDKKILF